MKIRTINTTAFTVNYIATALFFIINFAVERGFAEHSAWQNHGSFWLAGLRVWAMIGALAVLLRRLSWHPLEWLEFISTIGAMATAIWWLTILNRGEHLAAIPAVLVLCLAPFGLPAPRPGTRYDRIVRTVVMPIGIRMKAILLTPAFAPEPTAAEWAAKRQNGEQRGW